jgi:hypothetical protein
VVLIRPYPTSLLACFLYDSYVIHLSYCGYGQAASHMF